MIPACIHAPDLDTECSPDEADGEIFELLTIIIIIIFNNTNDIITIVSIIEDYHPKQMYGMTVYYDSNIQALLCNCKKDLVLVINHTGLEGIISP